MVDDVIVTTQKLQTHYCITTLLFSFYSKPHYINLQKYATVLTTFQARFMNVVTTTSTYNIKHKQPDLVKF